MNGVTPDEIANEVASALNIPINLVTVTINGNGQVIVTISGDGAQVR